MWFDPWTHKLHLNNIAFDVAEIKAKATIELNLFYRSVHTSFLVYFEEVITRGLPLVIVTFYWFFFFPSFFFYHSAIWYPDNYHIRTLTVIKILGLVWLESCLTLVLWDSESYLSLVGLRVIMTGHYKKVIMTGHYKKVIMTGNDKKVIMTGNDKTVIMTDNQHSSYSFCNNNNNIKREIRADCNNNFNKIHPKNLTIIYCCASTCGWEREAILYTT